MIKIFPVIQGANPPISVSFIDAASELPVSLVGCTEFSAKAKQSQTGEVVAFTTAVLLSGEAGEVELTYETNSFANTGLYSVQITCQDPAGNTLILPSEEKQLAIRVGAQITEKV